jgi:hypothetical protein
MPSLLSPERTFERRENEAPGTTPEDKAYSLLTDGFRLR